MIAMQPKAPVLEIRGLTVVIDEERGARTAVDDLSLAVHRGQTLALVGESGSGKTLVALAVMGLLPTPPVRVAGGSVVYAGRDLLLLPERELCRLRGDRIAMIFQEPVTSLNPLQPVGRQVAEAIRIHQGIDRKAAREQVLALMELVGIPDPARNYRVYPHQLSGGIRQRVLIAMALSCRPELLIADEPTSALDTTVQAQVVDLLSRLIRDLGMSVLLITHKLGILAAMADRIAVLHGGRLIEEGGSADVLEAPLHPLTQSIVASHPFAQRPRHAPGLVSPGADARHRAPGPGCPFDDACPMAEEACRTASPPLVDVGRDRRIRCFARSAKHG